MDLIQQGEYREDHSTRDFVLELIMSRCCRRAFSELRLDGLENGLPQEEFVAQALTVRAVAKRAVDAAASLEEEMISVVLRARASTQARVKSEGVIDTVVHRAVIRFRKEEYYKSGLDKMPLDSQLIVGFDKNIIEAIFSSEKMSLPIATPSNCVDRKVEKKNEMNDLNESIKKHEVQVDGNGVVKHTRKQGPRKRSAMETERQERVKKVGELRVQCYYYGHN